MKNMFWVINKEKVYAYIVSIFTIIILFFMSHVLNSDSSSTEEVSTNIEQTNNIQNNTTSNIISINIKENTVNNQTETGIVPN